MSNYFSHLSNLEIIWLMIGFGGQALFSARFLLQWIKSEQQKRSVIPIEFWYLSMLGGVTLLAYAVHKRDPVFIMGQLSGVFIYARNLYFVYKEMAVSDGSQSEEVTIR